MKRALFYFDVDKTIGTGHLVRSRALAAMLGELLSIEVHVVMSDFVLDVSHFGWVDTWVSRNNLGHDGDYEVIVLDIRNASSELQTTLRKLTNCLVGIDDWGRGPFLYDLLIRPNLLNNPMPEMLTPNAAVYQGGQYILLDRVFEHLTSRANCIPRASRVLVCFGGGDIRGYTARAIRIISDIASDNDIDWQIVLGPAFGDDPEVRTIMASVEGASSITVLDAPQNFLQLFSSCDTAIISGGTMVYEACTLGIPALVLPQEQEQHDETRVHETKGIILRPLDGMYCLDHEVGKLISLICFDSQVRRNLHSNMNAVVSPNGARRVANIIKNHVAAEN